MYSIPPGPVIAPIPSVSSVVAAVTLLNETTVNCPDPAGIVAPVKEKPRTVPLPPDETVNPAAAASPPLAPVIVSPDKSN